MRQLIIKRADNQSPITGRTLVAVRLDYLKNKRLDDQVKQLDIINKKSKDDLGMSRISMDMILEEDHDKIRHQSQFDDINTASDQRNAN